MPQMALFAIAAPGCLNLFRPTAHPPHGRSRSPFHSGHGRAAWLIGPRHHRPAPAPEICSLMGAIIALRHNAEDQIHAALVDRGLRTAKAMGSGIRFPAGAGDGQRPVLRLTGDGHSFKALSAPAASSLHRRTALHRPAPVLGASGCCQHLDGGLRDIGDFGQIARKPNSAALQPGHREHGSSIRLKCR